MQPDTYVFVDNEMITLAEANARFGTEAFPQPIVGNCFRMSDYVRIPFIPPVGLIGNGILPIHSKMLLFGEPKTGKSFLATMLAHCIAERQPWLGFAPHPSADFQPTVYYIQTEISETEFKERLLSLIPSDHLFVETIHGSLLLGDNVNQLAERLEVIRPNLVILDPLYMLMDGDLNNSTHMGVVHRNIDMLISAFGCSVLIVHHSRKPKENTKASILEALGSVTITAFYDSILFLERQEGYNQLHFTLRHSRAPDPIPLYQEDTGYFSPIDPRPILTHEWLDLADIHTAMHLNLPLDILHSILNNLSSQGLIQRNTARRYRLP